MKDGCIVAVKGLGGFHLATDAENSHAVTRLRKNKAREEKPFAVMSYDIRSISGYAYIGDKEADLLTSAQRPIVLLKKKPGSGAKELLTC